MEVQQHHARRCWFESNSTLQNPLSFDHVGATPSLPTTQSKQRSDLMFRSYKSAAHCAWRQSASADTMKFSSCVAWFRTEVAHYILGYNYIKSHKSRWQLTSILARCFRLKDATKNLWKTSFARSLVGANGRLDQLAEATAWGAV